MNEDFLEILYRGDGSELNFAVFHYEELDQWWVGYFDYENQGWVEPITGKKLAINISKRKQQPITSMIKRLFSILLTDLKTTSNLNKFIFFKYKDISRQRTGTKHLECDLTEHTFQAKT